METEYASKGVAGSGLGLGIAGTALGLLNNGGLGGIFGGGMARTAGALAEGQLCAQLMAEVQGLKAEKYADKNTAEVYAALKTDTNRLADKIGNIEKWQAAEMAAAPLREQLIRQRLEFVERAVGQITVIRVPNQILTPGVPPVEISHPAAAPAA